jgi:hypothetical protein
MFLDEYGKVLLEYGARISIGKCNILRFFGSEFGLWKI